MSEFPVEIVGGQRRLWVHKPPDGEPMPVLEDQLGYAVGLGYRQCDAPSVPPVTVAPDAVMPDITPEPSRRRRTSA